MPKFKYLWFNSKTLGWPRKMCTTFAEVLNQDKNDGHFRRAFQVSAERVNMMQHSNAWLARVWQLTPTQKNLVPRFGFLREEGGILKSKTILPFPSCFIFRMMRPLNFEELDVMTSRGTLGLIEDTDGVLSICKIILEIKRFVVHFTDRIREATPELRNVEDIVNSGEVRR